METDLSLHTIAVVLECVEYVSWSSDVSIILSNNIAVLLVSGHNINFQTVTCSSVTDAK